MITEQVVCLDGFYLRSLTEDDVGARYMSWFLDNDAKSFIDYARQENSIVDLKNYVLAKNLSDNSLLLGIFDNESDRHIGNIKYEPVDMKSQTAHMGILIGEMEYRGQGIAEKIIKLSARWLNEVFSIEQITLGVTPDNINAISAYKKIGFEVLKVLETGTKKTILMMTLKIVCE